MIGFKLFKPDYVFLTMVAIFRMDHCHCGYEPKMSKKYPEWIRLIQISLSEKLKILVWGDETIFSLNTKYLLCNLPQMGVRYKRQGGNTRIQHKEPVQNHTRNFYQPHFVHGRSDSWFQGFVLITKKPFIVVPKKS